MRTVCHQMRRKYIVLRRILALLALTYLLQCAADDSGGRDTTSYEYGLKSGENADEEDLNSLSNAELEAICTDRGFELVRERDADGAKVVYSHQDYVDAATQCLAIEAEMEKAIHENPDILEELEAEASRMTAEKERLEAELAAEKEKLKARSDGEKAAFVNPPSSDNANSSSDNLEEEQGGEDSATSSNHAEEAVLDDGGIDDENSTTSQPVSDEDDDVIDLDQIPGVGGNDDPATASDAEPEQVQKEQESTEVPNGESDGPVNVSPGASSSDDGPTPEEGRSSESGDVSGGDDDESESNTIDLSMIGIIRESIDKIKKDLEKVLGPALVQIKPALERMKPVLAQMKPYLVVAKDGCMDAFDMVKRYVIATVKAAKEARSEEQESQTDTVAA